MSAKLNQLKSTDVTKADSTVTQLYQPTEDERRAREAIRSRKKVPRIKLAVSQEKDRPTVNITLDHPDQAYGHDVLMRAIGTSDPRFCNGLLMQLAKISATHGQPPDEQVLNFLVSVLRGIGPRDQLETMLGAQMAAVHQLAMDFARRLGNTEDLIVQEHHERTFNKLTRTFAAQVECLKKYHSTGEQRMVVEHLNVAQGGQAVVAGNITTGGAGSSQKPE
jgi:hypothetical protein